MQLQYRFADGEDAGLLIDLYNKSFYRDFVRYGECPAYGRSPERMRQSIARFPKEIILCGEVPVGVISVQNRDSGEYYVGCLCVIPEYQNRGIGTQAMIHLQQSHPDWKRISLVTPGDKKENIAFYTQKCGFSMDGTEMDGSVSVVRLVKKRV